MDLQLVKHKLESTPAFVLDRPALIDNLTELEKIKQESGCQLLYSIKALPLQAVLKASLAFVDGFSVSSLFEARLARETLGSRGSVHITTPGLRVDEYDEIADICSHISFNSMSQYQRLHTQVSTSGSLGLRLNPKLSFAADPRFDPCQSYSKLGVDLYSLNDIPADIEGLHVHTVFSCTQYQPLIETIALLRKKQGHQLRRLKWLNLGGGYLYSQINNQQPFIDLIKQLKTDYALDIYIEPGKAIVGNAGYLVSTVIDSFVSDDKSILVMDTSVNHNPEVFEYQKKPRLLEADENGGHQCRLVGSSCLAGDLFGDYRFIDQPKVGDRLVFADLGAYSLIKANRFNGYNLPDVYAGDHADNIILLQRSSYNNYREQWGENDESNHYDS